MFFNKNEKAVSPIIATLVLIVVAIVGAVAIGLLLGTFSGNVQQQTSNGQMGSTGSNHLLIGGSTTVQPLSVELSKGYMTAHPGISIDVQGGGSAQGRIGANQGVLDIGSASDSTDTVTTWPGLVQTEIGGSCVVVIAKGSTATVTTSSDVIAAYKDATAGAGTTAVHGAFPAGTVVYQRSDVSGTEDCFSKYLSATDATIRGADSQLAGTTATGVASNGDMITKVNTGTTTLGFSDHGMVMAVNPALILGIDGATQADMQSAANVKAALKLLHAGQSQGAAAGKVPTGLCRNLFYLTKGQPSGLTKDYINWVLQPGQTSYFSNVGYFSTYDYY